MTLKTSLFNKGVYKSTLRRYAWGSVLYFILLFLSTGIMIFLNEDPQASYSLVYNNSRLLSGEYMIIPMLLSIAVPTIVGLMVFRFIHSRKASVFVHSLPVKRSANYISSILAALTLMAVPVMLNTAVLTVMSVTIYSLQFTVGDCMIWMLLNLLSLFVMFSCVCFVASITGNSFAMVGLNVIFHIIGLVFAAAFSVFADIFLFGFAGEGELIDKVFDTSFITRIPTMMTNWGFVREEILAGFVRDAIVFSLVAVLLYILGGILYSKRRMETTEDVAGFKCLNYIFKYLVTFMAGVVTFAVFSSSLYSSPVVLWIAVFIVSAVVYFGSEMLLKKTLRVWKAYKGYLAFVVVFALLTCICAFTSFFGFETYVPKIEEIESAAVYNYYYNGVKPMIAEDEVIEKTQTIHSNLTGRKKVLADRIYDTRIHIEYTLKNGKAVHRVYPVTGDELHAIMNTLYENQDYKKASERIFAPMKSIYRVSVIGEDSYVDIDVEKEQLMELIDCIREDVLSLSYNRINSSGWETRLEINYVPAEIPVVEVGEVQVTARPYDLDIEDENVRIEYLSYAINPNFEKTMAWLSEHGYWETISIKNNGSIFIVPESEASHFFGKEGVDSSSAVEHIKIENDEDKQTLIDYIHTAKTEYISSHIRNAVYKVTNETMGNYKLLSYMTREELIGLLPDYDFKFKE